MKKQINKILGKFGLEIHGVGYMQKLNNLSNTKDAFDFQTKKF